MSVIHGLANQLYHYQGGQTEYILSRCGWNDGVGRSIQGRIAGIVTNELHAAKSKFHDISNVNTENIENALELAKAHLSMY